MQFQLSFRVIIITCLISCLKIKSLKKKSALEILYKTYFFTFNNTLTPLIYRKRYSVETSVFFKICTVSLHWHRKNWITSLSGDFLNGIWCRCFGSASPWSGCGSGSCLSPDAYPDPDPSFHFHAYPDLDPSFQINAQNFEKVLR